MQPNYITIQYLDSGVCQVMSGPLVVARFKSRASLTIWLAEWDYRLLAWGTGVYKRHG